MEASATSPDSLAAVSADVEDYFQVEDSDFCLARSGDIRDRTVANTERLLAILGPTGRGTFYVLGWTAQGHQPVRRIAQLARDRFAWLPQNSSTTRTRPAFREKSSVPPPAPAPQRTEVIGYRAPSYNHHDPTLLACDSRRGVSPTLERLPIARRRYGMPSPDGGHTGGVGRRPQYGVPAPTVRLGIAHFPARRCVPVCFRSGFRSGRSPNAEQAASLRAHDSSWNLILGQPRFRSGSGPVDAFHSLDQAGGSADDLLKNYSLHTQGDVLRRARADLDSLTAFFGPTGPG